MRGAAVSAPHPVQTYRGWLYEGNVSLVSSHRKLPRLWRTYSSVTSRALHNSRSYTMKTQANKLPRFRLCVMGKIQKGKKLVRVRRMKYVPAENYAQAAEAMTKIGPVLAKGMQGNVFAQIGAPLQ